MTENNEQNQPGAQPIFLAPSVVIGLALLQIAIFFAQSTVLDEQAQLQLGVWLGFIPARLVEPAIPGGQLAGFWSLVTHSFLHGSWTHVLLNSAWLLVFGTPVARRFGNVGFLITFFVGAVAGALFFTALEWGSIAILVGASGGVSALTGLAMRFMFQPMLAARHPISGKTIMFGRRIGTLSSLFTEQRARAFTLFWLGLNLAIPIFGFISGGGEMQIAWQAHIGGFIAGLLLADILPTIGPRDENDFAPQDAE